MTPGVELLGPVAVLGQGSIGRRHAATLVRLGCEVIVFDPYSSEPPPDGATAAADEDAALRTANAVVVASPTSEHGEQALRAVGHGCHALIEKPIATDGASARRMVAAAAKRGCVLAVAMNLRFHPGPMLVRELVTAGRIGRPLTAHFTFGSYLPDWRPGSDYRKGYSARRELGGGVLLDVIHELDYASWILGPVRDVSARIEHVSSLEIDVEDVVLLHAHFEAGTVATFALDYLDRRYRRGCRIVGCEGTVEWDFVAEQVSLYRAGMSEPELRHAPSDVAPTYERELAEFAAAAAQGRLRPGSQLAGGSDGAAVMAIVEAARESARRGASVYVDPIDVR